MKQKGRNKYVSSLILTFSARRWQYLLASTKIWRVVTLLWCKVAGMEDLKISLKWSRIRISCFKEKCFRMESILVVCQLQSSLPLKFFLLFQIHKLMVARHTRPNTADPALAENVCLPGSRLQCNAAQHCHGKNKETRHNSSYNVTLT